MVETTTIKNSWLKDLLNWIKNFFSEPINVFFLCAMVFYAIMFIAFIAKYETEMQLNSDDIKALRIEVNSKTPSVRVNQLDSSFKRLQEDCAKLRERVSALEGRRKRDTFYFKNLK